MIILKALFLIFIVGVLAIGIAVFLLLNKVRAFAKKFSGQQESANGTSNKSSHTASQRTTQTSSGDTIIDTRHPDQVNKKIFSNDEGEYVEFEEKD